MLFVSHHLAYSALSRKRWVRSANTAAHTRRSLGSQLLRRNCPGFTASSLQGIETKAQGDERGTVVPNTRQRHSKLILISPMLLI